MSIVIPRQNQVSVFFDRDLGCITIVEEVEPDVFEAVSFSPSRADAVIEGIRAASAEAFCHSERLQESQELRR